MSLFPASEPEICLSISSEKRYQLKERSPGDIFLHLYAGKEKSGCQGRLVFGDASILKYATLIGPKVWAGEH